MLGIVLSVITNVPISLSLFPSVSVALIAQVQVPSSSIEYEVEDQLFTPCTDPLI